MSRGRILIIATNVGQFSKIGFRTGLWLGELTHFWDEAEKAGFEMDIASPEGGVIPVDPESVFFSRLKSLFGYKDRVMRRYYDRDFMDRLNNTLKISQVSAKDYDAIYMTGGHGVMFDFPKCEALARLTADFWEAGKIVSAVCHGVAGLLGGRLQNGDYLVSGRNVTGFSWDEEQFADRVEAAPFNLEDELRKRGAFYRKNFEFLESLWSHVVSDDRLITGQNPRSARETGRVVMARLARLAPPLTPAC